jgi:predicted ATPase
MELVGRDAELGVLRDALAAAGAGRGGVVLLIGPAGMGKSALLSAFGDEAARAEATVLEGSGWESGGAPAYWPWIQALRALLRVAGIATVREWDAGLPRLVHAVGSPRRRRSRPARCSPILHPARRRRVPNRCI